MKIFYVTNKKPLSHNKSGSSAKYKTELQEEFALKFASLYSGLPICDKTLQSHVVFIHQLRKGTIPDADNLSKPLVDAFSGVIYNDDSQVIRRTADILELNDFDFMTVEATYMPIEIYKAFHYFYLNKERYILFYEVADFLPSQIRIGEI